MFRHIILRRFNAGSRRSSTDGVPMAPSADEAFVQAWRNAVPHLEPPQTSLSFAEPRPPATSSVLSKLTVNFVFPYSSELSHKEVDMVTIPATTGQMGILPGHVATIVELQPGLLSVQEASGVKKYFVSSGFAFVPSNSLADIIAAEAIPVDQLDATLIQKGLAEFTQELSAASTDLERAEAKIGVNVHPALNSAISG